MNNNIDTNSIFFKCGVCALPLSIFPINYHKKFGNICGRCQVSIISQNEGISLERQSLFENMVSKLVFFCPFRKTGCPVELNQESAKDHETNCLFKMSSVICPFSNAKYREWCGWFGDPGALRQHLCGHHEEKFRNPIELLISKRDTNELILANYHSSILMIFCNYQEDLNEYHIYILSDMNFKRCLEHKYSLTIGNTKNYMTFEGSNLEYMFEHFGFLPDKKLALKCDSLMRLFTKNTTTTLKFSIIPNNPGNFEMCPQNTPSIPSKIVEKIIEEIRCPVCVNYMGGEIYSCLEGHNICGKCEARLKYCPLCKACISDGRNFTLERFAKMITLPCSFRNVGCTYLSSVHNVELHEKNCLFFTRKCIFNDCKWLGEILQLPEHLEENHSFYEINQIYMEELKASQQYAFLFEDEIFMLLINYKEGEYFGYSMNCLEGQGSSYKFELEFIVGKKKRDVYGDVCEPLSLNSDMTSCKFVSLPLSKIGRYIRNNVLTFRIQIETKEALNNGSI